MSTLGFFSLQNIGLPELLVVGVIGLLLFGKRLPEVGRGLGRSIVEFKRGLKGMADDVEDQASKTVNAPKSSLPSGVETVPPWQGVKQEQDVRVSRSEKVE